MFVFKVYGNLLRISSINSLVNSIEEFQDNLNQIIYKHLNEFQLYLGLNPIFKNFTFKFIERNKSDHLGIKNIFNIGVKREIIDEALIIEVNKKYRKFLPFIILREIYNLFVPFELID